ncbi:hypothetical protein [Wolbachia endosymbiont (group E) of Neria commutata]|uniref:hypothetical protein n=1 Tax=Wolbachia endosymbiont (group E) of Neria commutata TaxID=3066149 RepID=UPI003132D5B9
MLNNKEQQKLKAVASDWFTEAAQEGYSEVVEFLKKNGANLNAKDKKILSDWFTKVAQEGYSEVIGLFGNHDHPCLVAANEGNWEIVKYLLEAMAQRKEQQNDTEKHETDSEQLSTKFENVRTDQPGSSTKKEAPKL